MKQQQCFVCNDSAPEEVMTINKRVYLPVCDRCRNSESEKKREEEFLDSLADDLVCGCI